MRKTNQVHGGLLKNEKIAIFVLFLNQERLYNNSIRAE